MNLPEVCPVCGTKLEWKGVDLICPNKNCDNLKQFDLEIWTEILGAVEGVKWLTVSKYLNNLEIKTVEDLMIYLSDRLPDEAVTYTSITDKKVLEVFSKIGNFHTLSEGLQALNIERLGQATSEKLANNKDMFESILKFTLGIESLNYSLMEELVGPATTKVIKENSDILNRLRLIRIKPFEEPKNLDKGTFCITGKLNSGSRDEIIKLAESKGWKSLKFVTKECNYLVTNDTTSGSSKNEKAKKLGTKIINEEEFLNLINS